MKKILLGLGTIATIATPIIAVVSCGDEAKKIKVIASITGADDKKRITPDKRMAAEKEIPLITPAERAELDKATTSYALSITIEKIKNDRKAVKKKSIKLLFDELLKHSVANLKDGVDKLEGTGTLAKVKGIETLKKTILSLKGVFTLLHDVIERGLVTAVGTEANFVQNIKDLFGIDLSANIYLPLIKGLLFGFKNIDNFHMAPLEFMGLHLDIEALVKKIVNNGIVFALYNDPLLKLGVSFLPYLKEVIDTGDIKKPKDKEKHILYYGEGFLNYNKNIIKAVQDFDDKLTVGKDEISSSLAPDGTKNINNPLFSKEKILQKIQSISGLDSMRSDSIHIMRSSVEKNLETHKFEDEMNITIDSPGGSDVDIKLTGFKKRANNEPIEIPSSPNVPISEETTKDAIQKQIASPTSVGIFSSVFKKGILNIDKNDLTILAKFLGSTAKSRGLLDFLLNKVDNLQLLGIQSALMGKISPIISKVLKYIGLLSESGHEEIFNLIISVLSKGTADINPGNLASILRLIREFSIIDSPTKLSFIDVPIGNSQEVFEKFFGLKIFSKLPHVMLWLQANAKFKMAAAKVKAAAPANKESARLEAQTAKQALDQLFRDAGVASFAEMGKNNQEFITSLSTPSEKDILIAGLIRKLLNPATVIGEMESSEVIGVVSYFYDVIKDISAKLSITLPSSIHTALAGLKIYIFSQPKIKDLIKKLMPAILAFL